MVALRANKNEIPFSNATTMMNFANYPWAKTVPWSVGLGLLLRFWHYLRCPSVWMDEANGIVNVLNLDYKQHLGPLLHHEALPPLFLMVHRFIVSLFGDGVFVLRAFSFLSSCVALLLVASLARRVGSPLAAAVAVFLFATSDDLLFHAVEAKPYSSDAMIAALVAWLFVKTREWSFTWRCVLGAVLAPVGIWISFPASFVFGGWLMGLLPTVLARQTKWQLRLAYFVFVASVFGAFVLLFLGPIRAQHTPNLDDYWKAGYSFPNWQEPWMLPVWSFLQTAEVVRYCVPPWGNGLLFFVVWGAVALVRRSREDRDLVLLLLAPIAAAWVAALLGKYPYGASRTMVFAAPAVVLLVGAGVADFVQRIWPQNRYRWWTIVIGLYLLTPLWGCLVNVVKPWDRPASDVVTAYIQAQRQPGEPVAYNHWDYEYYLRDLPLELQYRDWEKKKGPWTTGSNVVWVIYTDNQPPPRCPITLPDGFEVVEEKQFHKTTVYRAEKK